MKVIGKALKNRYRIPSKSAVHRFNSTAIGCVRRMTERRSMRIDEIFFPQEWLDLLKGVLTLFDNVCTKLRSLLSTGAYKSRLPVVALKLQKKRSTYA